MIVSMIHQKGGTGKSSLAVALAMYLSKLGESVLLLDTDSQGTSSVWGRKFSKNFGVQVDPLNLRMVQSEVEKLKLGYDVVIIDSPPSVTASTEPVIMVSDILVSPMRPTKPDAWALDRLVALVLVSKRKPAPPHVVVLNQVRDNEAGEVGEALRGRPVYLCQTSIPLSDEWSRILEGNELSDQAISILSDLWNEIQQITEKGRVNSLSGFSSDNH